MSQGFAPALAAEGAGTAPIDMLADLLKASRHLSPDAADLVGRAFAFVSDAQKRLMEQQRRIGELESLSVTDPLTGLLNRRGFEQALARTLAASRRHGAAGVLAYIDLDGFKQINDSFGHETGDAVLRHVAGVLARSVRATDYVARLGGDEFAVIFTNTAPQACRPILQKLRRAFNGSLAQIDERLIEVRASIGTEGFGQDSELKSLIGAADKAMYRAKHRRIARAA
jgi:diguanylate cyclase (GGDEF)-like protein